MDQLSRLFIMKIHFLQIIIDKKYRHLINIVFYAKNNEKTDYDCGFFYFMVTI